MGYGLAYRNSEPCGDEQKIVFICRLQTMRSILVRSSHRKAFPLMHSHYTKIFVQVFSFPLAGPSLRRQLNLNKRI